MGNNYAIKTLKPELEIRSSTMIISNKNLKKKKMSSSTVIHRIMNSYEFKILKPGLVENVTPGMNSATTPEP